MKKLCFNCAFFDSAAFDEYMGCWKRKECVNMNLERTLWVPNAFAVPESEFIAQEEMTI